MCFACHFGRTEGNDLSWASCSWHACFSGYVFGYFSQSARCPSSSSSSSMFLHFLSGLVFRMVGYFTNRPLLGAEVLAGYLMFATVTGILMALFLDNVGGAWDNAKKYIEIGNTTNPLLLMVQTKLKKTKQNKNMFRSPWRQGIRSTQGCSHR